MKPLVALATFAFFAGCKENLLDDLPDASTDASIDALPVPPGDFSCVDLPYVTTAPDPLLVRGITGVSGGVTVEVHDAMTDALLFTRTSDATSPDRMGKYSGNLVTGGTAPRLYRHFLAGNGHLDTYSFDGMPVSFTYELGSPYVTEQSTQFFYDAAGVTRDRSKGTIHIDVFDCYSATNPTQIVEGATVVAPPGATVVYSDPNGMLDRSLTATTSRGTALIFNVTPGYADVAIHAGPINYRPWPVRVYADSWTHGPRHP